MESEGNLNLILQDTVAPSLTFITFRHSGWDWVYLGGYQARCNCWLVGLELEVDWMSNGSTTNFQYTDADSDSWSGSAQYKRETNVGLTARLGYPSPCLLPYIRAGLNTTPVMPDSCLI